MSDQNEQSVEGMINGYLGILKTNEEGIQEISILGSYSGNNPGGVIRTFPRYSQNPVIFDLTKEGMPIVQELSSENDSRLKKIEDKLDKILSILEKLEKNTKS